MKFKRFDRSVNRMSSKPIFAFTKSGAISLNRSTMDHLGLKSKDKVELLQDEDNPKDWYVAKSTSEHGFVLRHGGKKSDSLIFNSRSTTIAIQQSLQISTDSSFRIPVAPQPMVDEGNQYWALLTRGVIVKEKTNAADQ